MMVISEICFITTCMGRLAHLRETLPAAAAQPGASHVVVDYSCPEGSGDWVTREFPHVKVVRVTGKAHFHISAARNAGAAAADAPWLFFRDADVGVAPSFNSIVLPMLREGGHYRSRLKAAGPLSGALICSRVDFDQIGGYDEVMKGWGYEDSDLYLRLRAAGSEARLFPEELLLPLDHDNATRVAHYEVKHREYSRLTNQMYSMAKLALGAQAGRALDEQARRVLHRDVSRAVTTILRERRRRKVEIRAQSGPTATLVIDPATGTIEQA